MPVPPPIAVDARAATPLYDQIAAQVKQAVAGGTLTAGDALPSVRQLAVRLRVNPNTVARAYRELEADGVVESRRGHGTFVAASRRRLSPAGRREAVRGAARRLVAEALAVGMAGDELEALVSSTWAELAAGRAGQEDDS